MKQEKFPHNRKPTHRHISGELLNFRGQPNQTHTHTHTHTEYIPNSNYQWRSSSLASASSKWGLGREAQVAS